MKKSIHTLEIQKEKFIKCILKGVSFAVACRATKLSRTFIFTQRRDSTEFGLDIDSAADSRIIIVEDALLKSAKKGNVIAQIFYLKNRGKGKWSDRTELEFIAPRVVKRYKFIQAGEEPIIEEEEVPEEKEVETGDPLIEEITTGQTAIETVL